MFGNANNIVSGSGYPDIKEAMRLWEDGIRRRREDDGFVYEDEYRFHTMNIAAFCRLLASKIPGLNIEKAYICGLLHDYGKKYDERKIKRFHGLLGYLEMMDMGYPDIARICISHTFPVRNFDFSYYPSYPQTDLEFARSILDQIRYDDYDRLVQYCDLFLEALKIMKPADRIKNICKRYNLTNQENRYLNENAAFLKKYFDEKCAQDTFSLLGF